MHLRPVSPMRRMWWRSLRVECQRLRTGRDRLPTDEEISAIYIRTVGLLRYLAGVAFNIPGDDVEPLVQDTFLAFVAQAGSVRDPKSWLVGTLRNSCRHYWRTAGGEARGTVSLDDAAELPAPDSGAQLVDRLTVERVLAGLSPRDRNILQRFYVRGDTAATLAVEDGTTVGTIQVALHRSRRRAQRVYRALSDIGGAE